ncbi:MAG: M14 family metallopeptidase [Proteobacteria bacterium]|nr:M14 family metallopeptidase [Pseudomonadota bacterium]
MLTIYDQLPDGLLDCDARHLHEILPGPSLIHLPGLHPEALFVSVLLHGNETTGWDAVRELLRKYQRRGLPRAMCLFIGNVEAARHAQRHLPGQPDYNRIWTADEATPEHRMAQHLLGELARLDLFAAVDVHNNTGKNPHYACVNRLEPDYLHLASLFSRTVVYFIKPDTVMSMAMAQFCPAVTIECGQPGVPQGMLHVLEFIDACLHLDHFPDHPVAAKELDLFHTVATVKIPLQLEFGFGEQGGDLCLLPDIDRLNFNELPAGTAFGQVREADFMPFDVRDEQGREASQRYFEINDRWVQTRVPVMPSMLTLDLDVIRQDCLCYLMERLALT